MVNLILQAPAEAAEALRSQFAEAGQFLLASGFVEGAVTREGRSVVFLHTAKMVQADTLANLGSTDHSQPALPSNRGLHRSGLAALPACLSYTPVVALPTRTDVTQPAPPVKRERYAALMTFRRYCTIALLIPYLGVATGIAVSYFYWGYWLRPPCSGSIVDDVVSVDRFSTFSWDGNVSSGRIAMLEAAATTNSISGDDPRGRLAAALVTRNLTPASSDSVDPLLLPSAVAALSSAGKLLPGSPQYPDPAKLHGSLAQATTRAGNRILLAALTGGQASNDHYPYYEGVFALDTGNHLSLQRLHFYYWDFAGLEGIAHWYAGAATVLAGLVVCLLVGAGVFVVRRLRGAA